MKNLRRTMAKLGVLICGALGVSGCGSSSVDVFAGELEGTQSSRTALERLSSSLKENPGANSFHVRWTLKKADGSKSYPDLTYDRGAQSLTEGGSGAASAIQYSGVTDQMIHTVAAKHDAIVGLAEIGARQQVLVNGQPYTPTK